MGCSPGPWDEGEDEDAGGDEAPFVTCGQGQSHLGRGFAAQGAVQEAPAELSDSEDDYASSISEEVSFIQGNQGKWT